MFDEKFGPVEESGFMEPRDYEAHKLQWVRQERAKFSAARNKQRLQLAKQREILNAQEQKLRQQDNKCNVDTRARSAERLGVSDVKGFKAVPVRTAGWLYTMLRAQYS